MILGVCRSAGGVDRSDHSAPSDARLVREADLEAYLAGLVDRVTRRMRAANRVGRTVVLRLRFDDFSRATRSHTMPRSTAHTQTILIAVKRLLAGAMPMIEQHGITLVGISVANLDNDDAVQLTLPFDRYSDALDGALDELRERFGSSAITRGGAPGTGPRAHRPAAP